MSDAKAKQLWDAIVAKVKEAELDPPLWRAVDAAVPIALEGTTLIIGFEPRHEHEMAFIANAQEQTALGGVLKSIATKPVELRPIDGTTAEDYVHWQERDRLKREILAGEPEPERGDLPFAPPTEGGTHATGSGKYLQDLVLDLRHRYMKLPNRTSSYVKASFLYEILPDLVKAETELRQLERHPEAFLRAAARMIDRVAEIISAEPLVVALEFKRFRREHSR